MLATTLLAMALTPWSAPTPLPAEGNATYYAAGVMEATAAYRLRVGDVQPCVECIGYVAMMRRGDLGRRVWIEYAGELSGPYLVVDCAAPAHFATVTARGLVVEVSREQARAWGMRGPVAVTVHGEVMPVAAK